MGIIEIKLKTNHPVYDLRNYSNKKDFLAEFEKLE